MITIKQALLDAIEQLKHHELPRLEAEILLAHTLQVTRPFLISHADDIINSVQYQRFITCVSKRIDGVPIAYIVGHKEFWSLDFTVNDSCLIPRPETELLVELVLAKFTSSSSIKLLDLGTGSGAIALSIASERPHWNITATDSSEEALTIAQLNAQKFNLNNVMFKMGNWFLPLTETYNVIVSNPPYIRTSDPHLKQGDVQFEPYTALASGVDGLDDIRFIIHQAKNYLITDGWVFIEHGYDQGNCVHQYFSDQHYDNIKTIKDYAGNDRITFAQFKKI